MMLYRTRGLSISVFWQHQHRKAGGCGNSAFLRNFRYSRESSEFVPIYRQSTAADLSVTIQFSHEKIMKSSHFCFPEMRRPHYFCRTFVQCTSSKNTKKYCTIFSAFLCLYLLRQSGLVESTQNNILTPYGGPCTKKLLKVPKVLSHSKNTKILRKAHNDGA